MTIELQTPWTVRGRTNPAGALLATPCDDFLKGRRDLAVLFEPAPATLLAGYTWTRRHLVLNVLVASGSVRPAVRFSLWQWPNADAIASVSGPDRSWQP